VRNAALCCARGRYIAFIDSDDLWEVEKLDLQIKSMGIHRWGYTAYSLIDGDGGLMGDLAANPWFPYHGDIVRELISCVATVSTPSVIAERELVLEAGGFDDSMKVAEDYDLWMRLASREHSLSKMEHIAQAHRSLIRRERARNAIRYALHLLPRRGFITAFCALAGSIGYSWTNIFRWRGVLQLFLRWPIRWIA
jgi:glycosyltransferase involved in cell wall biosynthesis